MILFEAHTLVRVGGINVLEVDAASDCRALGQIIDRIADKWAVMVIGHLVEQETLRFNELMRAIPGVSHRMLTLTLRNLQRDGLVRRTPYATVPPRVEYALTPLGLSLTDPMRALAIWAGRNLQAVEAARLVYDQEGPVDASARG